MLEMRRPNPVRATLPTVKCTDTIVYGILAESDFVVVRSEEDERREEGTENARRKNEVCRVSRQPLQLNTEGHIDVSLWAARIIPVIASALYFNIEFCALPIVTVLRDGHIHLEDTKGLPIYTPTMLYSNLLS